MTSFILEPKVWGVNQEEAMRTDIIKREPMKHENDGGMVLYAVESVGAYANDSQFTVRITNKFGDLTIHVSHWGKLKNMVDGVIKEKRAQVELSKGPSK